MSSAESNVSAQAFTTLYSDHHGWLHGWLQRRLGNAWDAADLTQDTFVRVLGRPIAGNEPRALLTHIAKGLEISPSMTNSGGCGCCAGRSCSP